MERGNVNNQINQMDVKACAIVTGGAGFVGSHLTRALIGEGRKVVVIDVKKPLPQRRVTGARYVQMDVRDKALHETFLKWKPGVVFHLAAHIDNQSSIQNPHMDADHNVMGTLNVLEAMRVAGTRRILFASSCAVYGNQEKRPTAEHAALELGSPYGLSKRVCEQYLELYRSFHDISSVSLRKANIYGPGQAGSGETGAMTIFTTRLLEGQPIALFGDGLSTRDYVYIDDVVRAYLLAEKAGVEGVFNIGTGIETTTKRLFELVRDEVGVKVEPDMRDGVKDAVRHSGIDAGKALGAFGWSPEVGLEEGIEKTVEWYRDLEV